MRPTEATRRQARLAAALKMAGMTQTALAAKLGVSREHLRLVVKGERQSQRLLEAVEQFVAKHTPPPEKMSDRDA